MCGMSRLVKAATFLNPVEAHIFRSLLAAQGIESFVFDEQLQALIPLPTLGIKIMVREEDRLQARELLRELEASAEGEIRYLDED